MDQTVREIMARRRLESKPEAERFAEECRAKLRTVADIPTTYVLTVTVKHSFPIATAPLVSMDVANHEEFSHSLPKTSCINAAAAFDAVCEMLISEGFSENKSLAFKECPFMKTFSIVV